MSVKFYYFVRIIIKFFLTTEHLIFLKYCRIYTGLYTIKR
jgi:hypothetical protein